MILEDNEVALAGPAFDRPFEPLHRFGIIAATPRSGSHMLCRLLRQLGIGVAAEYFYADYRRQFEARWGASASPGAYLEAIARHRTAGGHCLIKCLTRQYPYCQAALAGASFLPAPHFIHIWRRDTLAQAISLRLAMQSGYWNFTAAPTTPPRVGIAVDDLAALQADRRDLIIQEMVWRAWLQKTDWPVFHVCYEDLIADRMRTLRRLADWLQHSVTDTALARLAEPASPVALHARQSLNATQRESLAAAYKAKFGISSMLADP